MSGSLPADPGFAASEILAAAASGDLEALLIGGVDPEDLPDPAAAMAAIESARFVVSLEQRVSAVTDRADVVLPVAAVAEKSGTFVNWEGRAGSFTEALAVPAVRSDLHVLAAIADEMDVHLGLPDGRAALRELNALSAHASRLSAGGSRGVVPPGKYSSIVAGDGVGCDDAWTGAGAAGNLA